MNPSLTPEGSVEGPLSADHGLVDRHPAVLANPLGFVADLRVILADRTGTDTLQSFVSAGATEWYFVGVGYSTCAIIRTPEFVLGRVLFVWFIYGTPQRASHPAYPGFRFLPQ